MSKIQKFKVGDKIRIIKYGHPLFGIRKMLNYKFPDKIIQEEGGYNYIDLHPEYINKEGVVKELYYFNYDETDDESLVYIIENVTDKPICVYHNQLELIKDTI